MGTKWNFCDISSSEKDKEKTITKIKRWNWCLLQGIWSASLISTFIFRFTEHLQFYFSFTIKLQKKSKLGGRNKKTLKISNVLFYNQAHSQRNWFITRRLTSEEVCFFHVNFTLFVLPLYTILFSLFICRLAA